MNISLKMLLGCVLTVFLLEACNKGELLNVQSYMKLNIDAFYTDTSLYYQVKLGDRILNEVSTVSGNKLENFLSKELEFVESGRLVIKVVKKDGINMLLDTTIFFTNYNEYLLVQLNPGQTPVFINKKTESVTLPKPGKDSVRIRFYYNETDELKRNNALMTNIDLQLYSYNVDSLFVNGSKEPPLKKESRLRNIKRSVLSDFVSVAYVDKQGKKRGYVCEIYPPGSNNATLPVYKRTYDEFDGFIGGNLELVDVANGYFETFRITKPDRTSPFRYGKYLFSF